jgi:hypothetical protein
MASMTKNTGYLNAYTKIHACTVQHMKSSASSPRAECHLVSEFALHSIMCQVRSWQYTQFERKESNRLKEKKATGKGKKQESTETCAPGKYLGCKLRLGTRPAQQHAYR